MAKAAKLAELDRPPGEVLGFEPAPTSDAEFDRGMSELAWLRSYRQTQEGLLNQRVALLKSEYAKKYFVEITEGDRTEKVAFADREAKLERALIDYARLHSPVSGEEGEGVVGDFFPRGRQTRELTHGTVSWSQGTESVLPLKGETDKTVLEKLKTKLALKGRLQRLMERLRIARGVKADVAVRLKVEVNKVGILQAFQKGQLTNKALKPYGVQVARPAPTFSIETGAYTLESASEEPLLMDPIYVKELGFPVFVAVALMTAAWLVLRWVGKNVVTPMVESHRQFLVGILDSYRELVGEAKAQRGLMGRIGRKLGIFATMDEEGDRHAA